MCFAPSNIAVHLFTWFDSRLEPIKKKSEFNDQLNNSNCDIVQNRKKQR